MLDQLEPTFREIVKLAVLRWLTAPSPFAQQHRLGLVTFRDPGTEGIDCLDPTGPVAEVLQPLDRDLFRRLRLVHASGDRSVRALVTHGVLPASTVCFEQVLCDAGAGRLEPSARTVRLERGLFEATLAMSTCSFVLVDVAEDRSVVRSTSARDGRSDLSGIGRFLERGQSVLVTRHVDDSSPIAALADETMADLHDLLGVEPLAAVRARRSTSMLVVVPHDRHRRGLEHRLGALQMSRWGDELRLHRWHRSSVHA